MSEATNGQRILSQRLKDFRDGNARDDGDILVDMGNTYPMIREFVLGGQRPDGFWPSGIVTIMREAAEVRITLRLPTLKMEAHYRGTSFYGMMDHIETDLHEDTTGWQADYRGRQDEERKLQV